MLADTNHIIHACAHASVAKGRDRLANHEIFARIAAYLCVLLVLCHTAACSQRGFTSLPQLWELTASCFGSCVCLAMPFRQDPQGLRAIS